MPYWGKTEGRAVKENNKKITRTEYSVRNTSVGMMSTMAAMIVGYLLRVVFTHTMSESYVGLNGLFTDIVSILSFSELGIGSAIMYALYRPVAEGDIEKQKSLMRLLRNFYMMVVALIAVIGCVLLPFLPSIVKEHGDIEHLTLIYLLYVTNTACTYLLIYKKMMLDAQQKMYIGVLFQTLSWILQDIFKIVVLVVWHDFVLFLVVGIVFTLLGNIVISKAADRAYPYLKDKDVKPLPEEEKKQIFANIRAMMMHKLGGVAVNNTDNIILSRCVNLLSVGCYSNYYLVLGAIRQVMDQIFQGITASVGNLGVTEDEKQVESVFDIAFFIGQWMSGIVFICLFELLDPFVTLSFGEKYLFSRDVVFVLCLNFYLNGMQNAVRTFKDSMGLFWYDRYKAVVQAVLNIVVSLILVKFLGVIGVFLGTTVSIVLTAFWVEPYVLYKYGFKSPCRKYFLRFGLYTALMAAVALITDFVCDVAVRSIGNLYLEVLVRLLLCVVVADALLVLIYFRTDNFKAVVNMGVDYINGKLRRK